MKMVNDDFYCIWMVYTVRFGRDLLPRCHTDFGFFFLSFWHQRGLWIKVQTNCLVNKHEIYHKITIENVTPSDAISQMGGLDYAQVLISCRI